MRGSSAIGCHFMHMTATRFFGLLALLFLAGTSIVSCTSAEDAIEKGDELYLSGQYAEAAQHYGEAIDKSPDDAEPRLKRAAAHARAGKYGEAIADYGVAITLAPDNINAYLNRGIIRGILGDYDGAVADYGTVLGLELLSPEDAATEHGQWQGSFTMWAIYLARGDLDKAISDYDKFVLLSPDQADAYMWRGCAYYWKGEFAPAIADYDTALDIDPTNSFVLYKRGLAYAHLDKSSQAMQDFMSALEIGFEETLAGSAASAGTRLETPLPTDHEIGIFHLNRGLERLGRADYDNAIADMDKARRLIDPQLIHQHIDTIHEVYYQSGLAYYDTGVFDQAALIFDKAVDAVPEPSDYPETLYQRGLSHYREGRYRLAIMDLERVLHLEQDFPDAPHFHRMSREGLAE